MKFTSLEHITQFLLQQDKRREDHYTLDRMHEALARLGRPDHAYKIVHVGGTSGKGSTSLITSSILQAAGHKVGLFVSPAIVSPLERIRINGKPVTEKQFVQLVNTVWPQLEDLQLTYFEFFTLFAVYHFADKQVDYAVLEVGMGGRLDATNAVDSTVAIVTTVGLDHTAQLGNTKRAIAKEKEQIIKGDTIGLTGSTFVKRGTYIDTTKVKLLQQDLSGVRFSYQRYKNLHLPTPATYQVHNAVLAIEAAQRLGIAEADIRLGLKRVHNPGRFEIISKRPLTIVDGAHNPQKMAAFSKSLQAVLDPTAYKRVVLLLSLKQDKDITNTLKHVVPFTTHVVITSFGKKAHNLRDIQQVARAMNPNLKIWLRQDIVTAHTIFQQQLQVDSLGLITGSLYMIGALRAHGLA